MTIKMTAIAVGALALGACSNAYDTHHAKPVPHYSANYHSATAPGYSYPVTGQHTPAQGLGQTQVYGQAHYGSQPHGPQHLGLQHAGPQTLSAPHGVYGSAVPEGAYGGLRGPVPAPKGYVYGEVGGVAYDPFGDTYGVQGRLGYQSASWFGAELEGSIGVTDENETVLVSVNDPVTDLPVTVPVDTDVGIDNQIAAFALARYPVSRRVNVIGRVGYHNTTFGVDFVDVDGAEISNSIDYDGVAFGSGIEFEVSPRSAIRADYTSYDTSEGSLDNVSLGYQMKF